MKHGIARVLRALAERIDPSDSPRYEPPTEAPRIEMPQAHLDRITHRHENPDSGYHGEIPPGEASWEHEPRWTRGGGGTYL